MSIIADLEVHSKYARAVSQQMTIPVIAEWAAKKGIDLVGTGDFTHPMWLREIETNLEEAGEGVYQLKNPKSQTLNSKFLLTSEVSCMYSHNGKGRRVHLLVYLPTTAAVKKFNAELNARGANLFSDGRPIMRLSLRDVAVCALEASDRALISPAHVWTPYFGFYGHMSGYDSLVEAFGDLEKYIPAVETGLSCYDSKTEVLTEEGWKKFSQITKNDRLCTLNLDTEEIEYQFPYKIFQSKYQGKMYCLKTKRVDLFVTPNHNLLYAPADFHTRRQYRLKEARSLFGKSKLLRKDGTWKGDSHKYFVLPRTKIRHGSRFYSGFREKASRRLLMKNWLKFFGFWIAEGWTTTSRRGDYNVCISNRNETLMSEMKRILENFGYATYWDNRITYTLRVRDYQLFSYLQQFGKAAEKFVPLEIKRLSKKSLEIFLDYYIKGDGHRYGRSGKGMSATTISTYLRDDLQEIALKIGISAYYKLHNKKGTLFSSPSQKRNYKQSADSWNIYFIRRNRHAIIPSEMKKHGYKEQWINYDGMIYCVSVPNRTLYIRRNGIPVWCGNSDPAMNWRMAELEGKQIVSFGDAHSPQKLGREATVFELEKLNYNSLYAALCGKTESSYQRSEISRLKPDVRNPISDNRIIYTIEFYPEEGKYHYSGHRKCGVVRSPNETRKSGMVCPVCGKDLTMGVMSRVEQLASGDIKTSSETDKFGVRFIKDIEGLHPKYVMLVPLHEILAESLNVGVGTKRVGELYERLIIHLGSEFDLLLKTPIDEIVKSGGERVAEAIAKVRSGDIAISPGYDGIFGKVRIWKDESTKQTVPIDQGALF